MNKNRENEPIISVKNISKKYNITHQQGGYIAMRDVMANIAKKPFSFLKKKVRVLTGRTTQEDFWALKDINFEIHKGEAVGIIGANGAGKSTLLKILTGITPPTTGEIKMHGKIASLLEVGTGFHPELTGRENIFLNGAILGMTKEEIAQKFDAIVEFSGVEKFIDTPVKRYSSGMLVRLGFSVAAHMEPDILLVDEVLAVGDAEFQKKCLGKMDEVTHEAGRTILFVSHNMEAVQNLCKKSILLKDGKIEMIGKTNEVIKKYLNINNHNNCVPLSVDKIKRQRIATLRAKVIDIGISNSKKDLHIVENGKEPIFFNFLINSNEDDLKCSIQMQISDEKQNLIGLFDSNIRNQSFILKKGDNKLVCSIPYLNLYEGNYKINFYLFDQYQQEIYDLLANAYSFSVEKFDPFNIGIGMTKIAKLGFFINHEWLLK